MRKMISGAQIESRISDPSHLVCDFQRPEQHCRGDSRFSDLRGVQWRIVLGISPSSTSIDVFRRVTADCRRRVRVSCELGEGNEKDAKFAIKVSLGNGPYTS